MNTSLLLSLPSPWEIHSALCFYGFDYFRFLIQVILCSICPSVSGLFYLVQCPPGSSMVSPKWHDFPFLNLNNIPLYMYIYTPSFLNLSVDEHLGNKSKNRQTGVHQNKNFCTAKEKVIKIKRQPTQRKEILVNHISDRRFISKLYEKLIYFKSKK